ncbi:2202_t:CDS:2, partial [Racocetra fulgida]
SSPGDTRKLVKELPDETYESTPNAKFFLLEPLPKPIPDFLPILRIPFDHSMFYNLITLQAQM